jgi:hypothetical protein
VGISLPDRLDNLVEYPLKPLTDRMKITSYVPLSLFLLGEELISRARGNMLLKIDGKNENPTQTLIMALQARGSKMSKEEDFYLAFIDGGVSFGFLF